MTSLDRTEQQANQKEHTEKLELEEAGLTFRKQQSLLVLLLKFIFLFYN